MISTIREARLEDAKEFERVMLSAYSAYDKVLDGIILPPMNTDYKKEISDYPSWVLECDGIIIGGLTMYFDKEHAHLSNVAVDPRFKKKGYGRQLIEFAEKQGKERGYKTLDLVTHVKLQDNIAYYKQSGYEEINRDDSRVFFCKNIEQE